MKAGLAANSFVDYGYTHVVRQNDSRPRALTAGSAGFARNEKAPLLGLEVVTPTIVTRWLRHMKLALKASPIEPDVSEDILSANKLRVR